MEVSSTCPGRVPIMPFVEVMERRATMPRLNMLNKEFFLFLCSRTSRRAWSMVVRIAYR